MIRGEKGFFGITGAPAGGLWWFARVSGPELTSAQAAAVTTAQWRDQLIAVFEADRTPAAAVVAATTEPIVGTGNYDVPTVPTWHNGRMTIAGDAAHAASPAAAQGASMAIEDAVVLAKCLRDIADPATAFDTYERHRREPGAGGAAGAGQRGDEPAAYPGAPRPAVQQRELAPRPPHRLGFPHLTMH